MTTDTPRTDAARFEALRGAAVRKDCIPLKLGQELERELAASKAEVARLQMELDATCNSEELRQERVARKKAESDRTHLITQCANLLEELSEIKETYASIVQQPHFDEREVHCSCVPALRAEVERLDKERRELSRELHLWEMGVYYKPKMQAKIDELKAEIERLREWVRSEWPADQAEEIINNCKSK